MLIIMRVEATKEQIKSVVSKVELNGFKAHLSEGAERTVIGVVGNNPIVTQEQFIRMPGVDRIVPISRPYKLSSREFIQEDSVIQVNGLRIGGGGDIVIIGGPCAVESRSQLLEIAWAIKEAGANALRGGAFKPRTSPYSFQGLGIKALEYLAEAHQQTGLPVISEVLSREQIPIATQYVDILQIGARNMQNYDLLHAAGESHRPVLLKRGMSATVEELLMAAEYILSHSNRNVILCERGIRTFETATRNTTDINAIPLLKSMTHLPVFIDPSHSTGHWQLVTPVARAGIAAGADGILIEVHPKPEEALSDGGQSLKLERFAQLIREVRAIAQVMRETAMVVNGR